MKRFIYFFHRYLIVMIILVLFSTTTFSILVRAAPNTSIRPKPLQQSSIIYVDQDAVGANNGTSWANAFTQLQSALNVAGTNAEIWIAEGTYKPTKRLDAGNPRSATFNFHQNQGIALYGGFAGTETSRSQRDWTTHLTILSGDLSGNDGSNFTNNGENSYHVLTVSYTEGTIIFDGLIISGGNANGACIDAPRCYNRGGGINNVNMGNPILANITFQNNYALDSGGGMANFYESNPVLTRIMFTGNAAGQSGGGMFNDTRSNPTLTNVTFSGNTARFGGGLSNTENSNPTLIHVTFSGNHAVTSSGGGGIDNYQNSVSTVSNSILWGNSNNVTTGQQAQIANANGSNATVTYSLVEGSLYPGTGNINTNPLFLSDPNPGGDGTWGTADDDYGDLRLGISSPAIDNANAAACPPMDLRGMARPQDSGCDRGAYETNYNLQVQMISDPFPILTTTTQITYILSLYIIDNIPLTGVQFTNQIPTQTTFVSTSNGGLHSSGEIIWSGLSLPISVTFAVSVTSTLNEGDLLINTFAFTSNEGINLAPTQISDIASPKLVYLPVISK